MLFSEPLAVNRGQTVIGELHFQANKSFSYFIDMVASIDGTSVVTQNRVNLKDQVSFLWLLLFIDTMLITYCMYIYSFTALCISFSNPIDNGCLII